MYRNAYQDAQEGSQAIARKTERLAFDRALVLLEVAAKRGPGTMEATDALIYLRRLWTLLIEDLASSENDLSNDIKANLISIGIWVLNTIEAIRFNRSSDIEGLIEINTYIRDGLN